MAQEMLDYPDGSFAVDIELVESITRSYLVNKALEDHSKDVVDEKWFGPDVHSVETDWEMVGHARKKAHAKITQSPHPRDGILFSYADA